MDADAWIELNDAVLAAHEIGDNEKLVELYGRAAQVFEQRGKLNEACFHYTQAFVLSLEVGSAEAAHRLNSKLVEHGRDQPLPQSLFKAGFST